MEKLISVVVPVYNVERYLERCINSIAGQTYKNLEIILVDDKSTDSSGRICDEMCKKDTRITVIHKECNEGLGYARNTGIRAVTGDYVLFVDSDDYIDSTLCTKALSRIIESDSDICMFGSSRDTNGEITKSDTSYLPDEYSGDGIINDFLLNTIAQAENESGAPRIGMSAWRILYRADLFKDDGLIFYSERDYLNEDLFFRINLCGKIRKAAVIREDLYYYCYNGSSLTMSYRGDRFESSKRMYKKLIEETAFCDSKEVRNRCRRAFLNNLLVCIRQEVNQNKESSSADKRLREYCSDSLVREILSKYPIKHLPIQPRLLYFAVKMGWINVIKMLVSLKG